MSEEYEDSDLMMIKNEDNSVVWVPSSAIQLDENNRPFLMDTEDNIISLEYEAETNDETTPEPEETIIITTSLPSQTPGTSRVHWNHPETVALINAVETMYGDMPKKMPRKRKDFWVKISEMIGSHRKTFSPSVCKQKWENLVRAYKEVNNKVDKTGPGPSTFQYFDSIDKILKDRTTNSGPYSIDVATLPDIVNTETENEDESTLPAATDSEEENFTEDVKTKSFKRKASFGEYFARKSAYYSCKSAGYEKYVTNSLRKKDEELALIRRQLKLEERKVRALEALARAMEEPIED